MSAAAAPLTTADVGAAFADMKRTMTVLTGHIKAGERTVARARQLRAELRREMAEAAAAVRERAIEQARRDAALATFRTRRH